MKKLLYALLIILAIAGVVFAGYYLRSRTGEEPAGEELIEGGLPDAVRGTEEFTGSHGEVPAPGEEGNVSRSFGVLADKEVSSFFVDASNVPLVVGLDGQIARIVKNTAEPITSVSIPGLLRSSFSFDGKKVLVVAASTEGIERSSIFDMETKTWQELPGTIRYPVWSPANYTIAYIAESATSRALSLLDAGNATTKPQALLSLRAEDMMPHFAGSGAIALHPRSSAKAEGSVMLFDIKKKTVSFVAEDEKGLAVSWDNAGERALTLSSERDGRTPALSLRKGDGQILKALSILTMPSKCVFDRRDTGNASGTDFLFCGIPRNAEQFEAGPLPDAYEKRALFAVDDLYRIDLRTGDLEFLYGEESTAIDAHALSIKNSTLFLINRFDNKLYALAL